MDNWLREFLEVDNRQDLKESGKPFYKYIVTDHEYSLLKSLLKDYAEKLRYGVGIKTIENLFQIYLVLYAAEWWRREYKGGHWKWEPIFNSFGITDSSFISPAKRYKYIENGFKFWHLKLKNDGKRYLGTIAINGGLPISLITGGNRVSSLLDRLMVKVGYDYNDKYLISELIESDYSHYLPKTYQQGHIYDLIAEITSLSVELTRKYDLKNSKNPIDVLDSKNPYWREDFPISLNESEGQRLIESLILSSIKKPDVKKTSFFDIKYLLEFDDNQNLYELYFQIELDVAIQQDHLMDIFTLSESSLAPFYVFVIDLGVNGEIEVGLNSVFGKSTYKPSKPPEKLKITRWQSEGIYPSVYLRDKSGSTFQLINQNLSEIEPPVVVFTKSDSNIEYRFSGEGNLKEDNAIILLTSQAQTGLDLIPFGNVNIGDTYFQLYEINENTIITINNAGENYSVNIKVNSQLEDDDELLMIGNKVNGLINSSLPVYRGVPSFQKNGRPLNVEWYNTGTNNQVPNPLGYVTARISSNNGYVKRKRAIVLPSQSKEVFKERIDSRTCLYEFQNWGDEINFLVDENHNLEIVDSSRNNYIIRVEKVNYNQDELGLVLTLRKKSINRLLVLQLQWYATSIICLDRFGKKISTDSYLNVENLHGIRIFGCQKNRDSVRILLEVDAETIGNWTPHINDDGTFKLILNDFKNEIINAIEHLKVKKSRYDELGAVKFSVFIRDRREYQLNFTPFVIDIIKEKNKVKVTSTNPIQSDEYHNLLLKFIPTSLDYDKQKEIQVTLENWIDIDSVVDNDSNYYVFCETETGMYSPQIELKFNSELDINDLDNCSLLDTSLTSDNESKSQIINEIFQQMKSDLNCKWWDDLEEIISIFGHLRWRRIEIIKSFVNDPRLVALSLLNVESKKVRDFLIKIIAQNPVYIMKITKEDWEFAYDLTYRKARNLISSDDLAEKLYREIVLKLLQTDVVELFMLLVVFIKTDFSRYKDMAIKLDNTTFQLSNDNIKRIFDKNANSAYQKLLRSTLAKTSYPDSSVCGSITKLIRSKGSDLFNEFVNKLEKPNHNILLAGPILTAEYMYKNRTSELSYDFFKEVLMIKKYDPDWYNNVLKLTLSHYASNE